jgi:hypothetical protein
MAETITETAPTGDTDGQREMARITCPCGFMVVGYDEAHNRAAFEDHPCPNWPEEPEEAARRWYSYVFSSWGCAIVLVVACAVVVLVSGAAR